MLYLVDLDGTVCDFIGPLIERHNEISKDKLCREDINAWDLKKFGIADTTWQTPGFFISLRPLEGAVEVLYKMHQNGDLLWIVTNALDIDFIEEEKATWVREHLPFVRGIIFSDKKYELPADAIMIDDCPEYLEKFTGTTIKMNTPYNSHVKADYAADDWKDIDNIVNKGCYYENSGRVWEKSLRAEH